MRNKTRGVIRKVGVLRGKRRKLPQCDHCSREVCPELSTTPTDLKKILRGVHPILGGKE